MELYYEPDFITRRQKRDNSGRFVKGMTPWNKGTKGIQIGGKQTQFKPGHLPHNTKHDGAISIRYYKRDNRPYKYIRTANARWEPLHRYMWKLHNGEIPKGYVIRFKDGNTLNCDINNLECISRVENMNRNRNYEKHSKTMREKWQREKLRAKYGLSQLTKLRVKI